MASKDIIFSKPKGSINGFDILKILMATMIVAIHTNIKDNPIFHALFWPMVREAVPVFFILSSYFYFNKQRSANFDKRNLFHFVKRIGILYLFWLIVNIPFIIYFKSIDFVSDSLLGNILIFFKLCLFHQLRGYTGSWFFSGLIWAICIITSLKLLKIHDSLVILIGMICYCIVWYPEALPHFLMAIKYYFSAHITPSLNVTLFTAIPWCIVGYLLTDSRIAIWVNRIRFMHIFSITSIVYIVFAVFDGSIQDYAWRNLILAPLTVLLFYSASFPSWNRYKTLRNLSVLIFMLHFILIKLFAPLHIKNVIYVFFVVITFSILIGMTILKIENTKYFKWLQYSH